MNIKEIIQRPGVFYENGGFSWRKAGTALCFTLFGVAVLGYLITHDFDELPKAYQGIITLVFVFYFAKRTLEGKKIKVVNNDN